MHFKLQACFHLVLLAMSLCVYICVCERERAKWRLVSVHVHVCVCVGVVVCYNWQIGSPEHYIWAKTYLVNVAIGAGANFLYEIVLVLRIAPGYVRTEQIGIVVTVSSGHDESDSLGSSARCLPACLPAGFLLCLSLSLCLSVSVSSFSFYFVVLLVSGVAAAVSAAAAVFVVGKCCINFKYRKIYEFVAFLLLAWIEGGRYRLLGIWKLLRS